MISLKAAQQAAATTFKVIDAVRTALPGVEESRRSRKPLVESDAEWLVIHDPTHQPVRMDFHCPQCTLISCPGGGCNFCADDYFECCWGNCGAGGNGCCP